MVWQAKAWLGMARLGKDLRGEAVTGSVGCGELWHGGARIYWVRRDAARPGQAGLGAPRQGFFSGLAQAD